jgi:hypothetical protein
MPSATPEPAAGGDPVRSTDGPSYAATVEPIFAAKCTTSCHQPGGALGGPGGFDPDVKMDLSTGAGYDALMGKSAQLPSMWIVGSTLEDSYLWLKLNGTQADAGGKGAKMPVTGEFTADDMAAVQAWIEGGATP